MEREKITPIRRDDPLEAVDFGAGAALLISKPSGITSFDVVRRVRRLIGVKKVGHAGTLDPAASGLLIVLTGKATRKQRDFMSQEKEYLATILLGLETTTWDMEGDVVSEKEVPQLKRGDLVRLFSERFTGEIDQIPPPFSAVKKNGIPSYRYARRGQPVALEVRKVSVYSIEMADWTSPELKIRLRCSSGFYVRSLAHDIGAAVGCGATLKRLVRSAIGPYRLEDALGLHELASKLSQCPT